MTTTDLARPMTAPVSPAALQVAATIEGDGGALTLSLGATIAAPLPDVQPIQIPIKTTLSTSVLPRIEASPSGSRLVPTDGPRYESGRVLGAGGMGEVALAQDRDIGRKVALKRLHSPHDRGGTPSAASLARFVDEVRTVGQLEHPNIVPIHDVGVDEAGNYFFVMKYVDGVTLEDVIEKLKAGEPDAAARYTIARRVEIFVGILRALEYAHQRGIIHRDLKPANVMVGNNGEVILMDWGVARPIARPEPDAPTHDLAATDPSRASATHAGALIGTPLYMSPEQAAGRNSALDARSDLYAACQLFYELLSLHHRFEDQTNLVQLLAAIQLTDSGSDVHLFRRQHLIGVPAELAHFLRRGLSLKPDDRWPSASDMLFELAMIQDGRCRVQCAATGMKRSTREFTLLVDQSPMRAMALVASVGMSLVALLGVAIYGLVT
jgi:serine/threonine-protein kinase